MTLCDDVDGFLLSDRLTRCRLEGTIVADKEKVEKVCGSVHLPCQFYFQIR